MLVKFMTRGTGDGSAPINYLLGRDRQREGASVLRGDPEQVRELINCSKFSRSYTCAVLSFEENEISEELRQQCMNEFEEVLMAGLDADQYSTLWIEHRDKGRIELNVVIPNIELLSGKRLQPYYDRADRSRVDAWKTAINAEHNLADPDDPTRKRALSTVSDLPRDRKVLSEALTRGLMEQIQLGVIKDRDGVVRALQGLGLEVARETKTSLSIKAPDGGQNIRLKGAIYERDFKFSQGLRGRIESAGNEYSCQHSARARRARERLNAMLRSRAQENRKRYPRPQMGKDQEHILLLGNNGFLDRDHSDIGERNSKMARQGDCETLRTVTTTGELAERSSDALPRRGSEAALRYDRHASARLWKERGISGFEGGVGDDRDRATIGAGFEKSGGGASSYADAIRNFARRIRSESYGDKPTSRASRALERAISAVHGACNRLKAMMQKIREERRQRSRGR